MVQTDHLRNAKIVVLLTYVSNFFRSLEMPLINRNDADAVCNDRETTFTITSTNFYVPVVTI